MMSEASESIIRIISSAHASGGLGDRFVLESYHLGIVVLSQSKRTPVSLPQHARDMTDTLPSDWIDRVRTAERSGDFLVAYDIAVQGLAEHPGSIDLRYFATRVLARSGATDQAAALYRRFQLDREPKLDFAMLGARIAKDGALGASADRRTALRAAAAAYGRIYARTPDHYPAVNAATLYLLAGDPQRARSYARRALKASERESDESSIERYYRLASRAEAALICGDANKARLALQQAALDLGGNFDAAASTRKLLRLVCRATRTSPDLLDLLRPPAVLHYRGLAFVGDASRQLPDRKRTRDIIKKIAGHFTQHKIGYAYGSLSAGSEIFCAEACLRSGAELHVVLPFNKDEFVARVVRVPGSGWVRRFNACLDRAKSVTFATMDAYQGDNSLFTYSCQLAMGMAILRAQNLDNEVSHLGLQMSGWDPDPAGNVAGLRMWHAQGLASYPLVLTESSVATRRVQDRLTPANRVPPRFSRALLFGDVKGFSKTSDHLIPVFQKRMMGTIAGVLRRYDRHVLYRNSWGDAIYVVIDDPIVAAECSLAIQEAITRAKIARYGLSPELALRLSAHFGPVYDGHDPIRDEPTFFGAHTTLAARIEPVTLPGHVFVTEAMAAAIAMANASRLRAEYVGNVPMAKGFGSTRMYSLNRVG
jgi:class 3 adenylate cyclase/tetratricopeptide (TPR) repeat protein